MPIPKDKVALHLRLGRHLVQAIGTGTYFEDRTFDWIRLEPLASGAVRATVVRSFDEGDEWANDVATFSTLNQLEPEDVEVHEGTLESCLDWANGRGASPENFGSPDELNEQYARYALERDAEPE